MPKITASGRFKLSHSPEGGIKGVHTGSGLSIGSFSHIAVRTLKHAKEGLENVEASLTKKQLASLDSIAEHKLLLADMRQAQSAFRQAMEREFPDGAWCRY